MRRFFFLACALVATVAPLSGATAAQAWDNYSGPERAASPGDTLTLSLADAQRLALERNPAFLASSQERGIARGRLRQARIYPFNPEMELRAPGAASSVASSAGGGVLGSYEAFLGLEVEWAGQRGLRTRAAEIGLDRADASVGDAARRTLAEVSEAFYATLAAERRLSVVQQILEQSQRLLEATRTQARAGEISTLEASLAETEAGRVRARVLAVQREVTGARLELQRLTGLGPDQPVRVDTAELAIPDPTALEADSLLEQALARRPDLLERTRGAEQARALTRLARREALPNLRVGALATRDGIDGKPGIGLGVSLPIPLWNRNQGTVAERSAEAEQADQSRRATELAVRTEVKNAHLAYQAAHEESQIYEREVLRPARDNQERLETAYRAGKLDLPALLLLRNQLLDAELGYWDAWLAAHRAWVTLQAATAALLPREGARTNELEES